jgi:hypothetical protein
VHQESGAGLLLRKESISEEVNIPLEMVHLRAVYLEHLICHMMLFLRVEKHRDHFVRKTDSSVKESAKRTYGEMLTLILSRDSPRKRHLELNFRKLVSIKFESK